MDNLVTRFNLGKLTSNEVLSIKSHVSDKVGALEFERQDESLVLVFEDEQYIDSLISHLKTLKKQMTSDCVCAPNMSTYWQGNPYTKTDRGNFKTRLEAETLLAQINNHINNYGFMTVADYYKLLGINTTSPIYTSFGWYDANDVCVKHAETGWYYIEMPSAVSLRKK